MTQIPEEHCGLPFLAQAVFIGLVIVFITALALAVWLSVR